MLRQGVDSGGQRVSWRETYSLLVRALVITAVLTGAKWIVHAQGWTFISSLSLLTGLMGGVVFALAILLNGTIRDYKEAEQLLARFVTEARRVGRDHGLYAAREAAVRFGVHLRAAVGVVQECLRDGSDLRMRRFNQAMAGMDEVMAAEQGPDLPQPLVRTVQVRLGEMQRSIDRMEMIMETTFMRAGYALAGVVISVALAGFLFADVQPMLQALVLFAFTSLLLVGLFLVVLDMENPFGGEVRLNAWQLDKLARDLDADGA